MSISGKNLRGYLIKKKKYAPIEHRQYYNSCILKTATTKNYYNYIKSLKKDIKKTYKRIKRLENSSFLSSISTDFLEEKMEVFGKILSKIEELNKK